MTLLLRPKAIGYPDWEQLQPGDIADNLSQWYNANPEERGWYPMPIGVIGLPCRISNVWKRPVTWRAKLSAAWTAKGNLFARYILRKTQ